MPSGSHAGGGSSHSSGGSSYSSSSSSSSSSYSSSSSSYSSSSYDYDDYSGGYSAPLFRSRRRLPPGVMRAHRRLYYIDIRYQTIYHLANFFAILLIFASIFSLFFIQRNAEQAILANKDYKYYQDMRAYALNQRAMGDERYIAEARVDHIEYHAACGKWFLVYEFKGSSGYYAYDGYTYDLFTLEEASKLKGRSFEVALDSPNISQETDSVPLTDEFMPLNVHLDGDYNVSVRNSVIFSFVSVLCVAGSVLLFIGANKTLKKHGTPCDMDIETEMEQNAAKAAKQAAQTREELTSICNYCGSEFKGKVSKCPSCGAKSLSTSIKTYEHEKRKD